LIKKVYIKEGVCCDVGIDMCNSKCVCRNRQGLNCKRMYENKKRKS
jgi:hypothetical protein